MSLWHNELLRHSLVSTKLYARAGGRMQIDFAADHWRSATPVRPPAAPIAAECANSHRIIFCGRMIDLLAVSVGG